MDDELVRSVPLFRSLDQDAAAALLQQMRPLELARGQDLFAENDPGDALYIIASGKMKIGRRASDGRENLLAVLGPGEMLGELSLFDPGPRTASAAAVSEARLLELGHIDMLHWLSGRPEVARFLLGALARRLRRTNEALADLVFADVPGRVAKTLLELSQRFGKKTEKGIQVTHDLTQEELAQLIGASRETVNKALAEFANRGWIRTEARSVVLLDVPRLERRSQM